MHDASKNVQPATDLMENRHDATESTEAPRMPAVVDMATFQAELDALRAREKAHTHESDAIAAARRRLPMIDTTESSRRTGRPPAAWR